MSYINNADQSTTTSKALIDKPIVPIPDNIFQYLQRRPDGSANMLNFPVLRNMLSITDLANYAKCVDDTSIMAGTKIATDSFYNIMSKSIPHADEESRALLVEICEMSESFKDINTTNVLPGVDDKAEFKMLPEALYITIPLNFVASVWNYPTERSAFVAKYIEHAYTLLGNARVHSPEFAIFSLYIHGMPLLAD